MHVGNPLIVKAFIKTKEETRNKNVYYFYVQFVCLRVQIQKKRVGK